jgi:hypothetical protein
MSSPLFREPLRTCWPGAMPEVAEPDLPGEARDVTELLVRVGEALAAPARERSLVPDQRNAEIIARTWKRADRRIHAR